MTELNMQAAALSYRLFYMMKPATYLIIFSAFVLCSGHHALVAADDTFYLNGEFSTGQDSNPAQTAKAHALNFADVILNAAQHLRLTSATVTVGLDGWYRDYAATDALSRLTLHTDWERELAHGAGLLTVALAAAAYRDSLVPPDERDELAATVRYDHTLTARTAVAVTGETRQLAYLHAAELWAGRPGSEPRNASEMTRQRQPATAPPPPPPRSATNQQRTDWRNSVALDVSHHWSPTHASVLTLTAARNASPVISERYAQRGIGAEMRWEPLAQWALTFNLQWSQLRYDRAPRQQERTDEQHAVGVVVLRRLRWQSRDQGTWFCRVDWLDSASTRDEHSFQQQITSCGLGWTF
ncbi:surface lipoprotein assembly modifier [Chromatium okenii]|uniref:surface lipoprotein assembly modifier n=1 Tax=Chromatium okenii TaxID=61644 RepID=UPI001906FDCE|nr:surface lipoprotein assembly modifier [Chromatium okenii]